MKPTPAQFAVYQQVFDYFNRTLFENNLPDCMLSFRRRRRNSNTLFTAGQWKEKSGQATAEISLNIKQLAEDEPIEVMATLVRQMVHLWQEIHGHQTSSKWYFNREWAEKMAAIGLLPSATGKPGGKTTGRGIQHSIEDGGQFEQAFRKMPATYLWPFQPASIEGEKRGGYSEKVAYRCIGCGAKTWGKGGMGLVCECGRIFVDATGKPKLGLGEMVYRLLAEQYGNKDKIQEGR
ncbi:MAG: SprT-like domain-containing protein [Pseudomonadota bacterium]